MAFDYAEGIPHGKIVPMYLSDDGGLYTINFHDVEELELLGELVAGMLGHTIGVDINNPICDPKDPKQRLTIYKKPVKNKK